MASFYESLKDLFTQDMGMKVARVVEEKEANVNKAASHVIAGLLGVMAKKGNTTQIQNIFEEAGNINLISDVGTFDEHLTHPQQTIGDNFLQALLGDKAADFTDPISKEAGISEVAANRIISIIGPSFPAFFGKKMVRDNMSYAGIINDIKMQEKTFASKIPAGIVKAFNIGTVLDTTKTYANAKPASTYATSGISNSNPEPKKKNSWITWVLVIIAILLIFFWWRSCNNKHTDDMAMDRSVYMPDTTNVIAQANPRVSNAAADMDERMDMHEIALPNGEHFEAYKDGVEDKMVNYLNSEDYKKASAKDLEGKWFEFDNIAFEFGSTTELKEESKSQLNNIAAILKAHKDAKVMVAAFADKRGTETANMRVSKERAKTIEKMLENAGVGSQVVKTEGLGDQYAQYSADAPDSERMKDRDIAIRFVK